MTYKYFRHRFDIVIYDKFSYIFKEGTYVKTSRSSNELVSSNIIIIIFVCFIYKQSTYKYNVTFIE